MSVNATLNISEGSQLYLIMHMVIKTAVVFGL